MRLAKPHIDIGVFTDNAPAMLEFWQQEVGLAFDEALPLGGGVLQHRHAMNGSVFKLNASREPVHNLGASGYRELLIAREGVVAPRTLADPDGNRVTLVPPAYDGVAGIAVRVAARDAAALAHFYGEALQLNDEGGRHFRCGDSLLIVEHDPAAAEAGPMQARGYRYLTVQVWDVDSEHAGIIARGGREGRPPITLGTTARISFVRDPDGNWIEVSQRASLTGPLPSTRS